MPRKKRGNRKKKLINSNVQLTAAAKQRKCSVLLQRLDFSKYQKNASKTSIAGSTVSPASPKPQLQFDLVPVIKLKRINLKEYNRKKGLAVESATKIKRRLSRSCSSQSFANIEYFRLHGRPKKRVCSYVKLKFDDDPSEGANKKSTKLPKDLFPNVANKSSRQEDCEEIVKIFACNTEKSKSNTENVADHLLNLPNNAEEKILNQEEIINLLSVSDDVLVHEPDVSATNSFADEAANKEQEMPPTQSPTVVTLNEEESVVTTEGGPDLAQMKEQETDDSEISSTESYNNQTPNEEPTERFVDQTSNEEHDMPPTERFVDQASEIRSVNEEHDLAPTVVYQTANEEQEVVQTTACTDQTPNEEHNMTSIETVVDQIQTEEEGVDETENYSGEIPNDRFEMVATENEIDGIVNEECDMASITSSGDQKAQSENYKDLAPNDEHEISSNESNIGSNAGPEDKMESNREQNIASSDTEIERRPDEQPENLPTESNIQRSSNDEYDIMFAKSPSDQTPNEENEISETKIDADHVSRHDETTDDPNDLSFAVTDNSSIEDMADVINKVCNELDDIMVSSSTYDEPVQSNLESNETASEHLPVATTETQAFAAEAVVEAPSVEEEVEQTQSVEPIATEVQSEAYSQPQFDDVENVAQKEVHGFEAAPAESNCNTVSAIAEISNGSKKIEVSMSSVATQTPKFFQKTSRGRSKSRKRTEKRRQSMGKETAKSQSQSSDKCVSAEFFEHKNTSPNMVSHTPPQSAPQCTTTDFNVLKPKAKKNRSECAVTTYLPIKPAQIQVSPQYSQINLSPIQPIVTQSIPTNFSQNNLTQLKTVQSENNALLLEQIRNLNAGFVEQPQTFNSGNVLQPYNDMQTIITAVPMQIIPDTSNLFDNHRTMPPKDLPSLVAVTNSTNPKFETYSGFLEPNKPNELKACNVASNGGLNQIVIPQIETYPSNTFTDPYAATVVDSIQIVPPTIFDQTQFYGQQQQQHQIQSTIQLNPSNQNCNFTTTATTVAPIYQNFNAGSYLCLENITIPQPLFSSASSTSSSSSSSTAVYNVFYEKLQQEKLENRSAAMGRQSYENSLETSIQNFNHSSVFIQQQDSKFNYNNFVADNSYSNIQDSTVQTNKYYNFLDSINAGNHLTNTLLQNTLNGNTFFDSNAINRTRADAPPQSQTMLPLIALVEAAVSVASNNNEIVRSREPTPNRNLNSNRNRSASKTPSPIKSPPNKYKKSKTWSIKKSMDTNEEYSSKITIIADASATPLASANPFADEISETSSEKTAPRTSSSSRRSSSSLPSSEISAIEEPSKCFETLAQQHQAQIGSEANHRPIDNSDNNGNNNNNDNAAAAQSDLPPKNDFGIRSECNINLIKLNLKQLLKCQSSESSIVAGAAATESFDNVQCNYSQQKEDDLQQEQQQQMHEAEDERAEKVQEQYSIINKDVDCNISQNCSLHCAAAAVDAATETEVDNVDDNDNRQSLAAQVQATEAQSNDEVFYDDQTSICCAKEIQELNPFIGHGQTRADVGAVSEQGFDLNQDLHSADMCSARSESSASTTSNTTVTTEVEHKTQRTSVSESLPESSNTDDTDLNDMILVPRANESKDTLIAIENNELLLRMEKQNLNKPSSLKPKLSSDNIIDIIDFEEDFEIEGELTTIATSSANNVNSIIIKRKIDSVENNENKYSNSQNFLPFKKRYIPPECVKPKKIARKKKATTTKFSARPTTKKISRPVFEPPHSSPMSSLDRPIEIEILSQAQVNEISSTQVSPPHHQIHQAQEAEPIIVEDEEELEVEEGGEEEEEDEVVHRQQPLGVEDAVESENDQSEQKKYENLTVDLYYDSAFTDVELLAENIVKKQITEDISKERKRKQHQQRKQHDKVVIHESSSTTSWSSSSTSSISCSNNPGTSNSARNNKNKSGRKKCLKTDVNNVQGEKFFRDQAGIDENTNDERRTGLAESVANQSNTGKTWLFRAFMEAQKEGTSQTDKKIDEADEEVKIKKISIEEIKLRLRSLRRKKSPVGKITKPTMDPEISTSGIIESETKEFKSTQSSMSNEQIENMLEDSCDSADLFCGYADAQNDDKKDKNGNLIILADTKEIKTNKKSNQLKASNNQITSNRRLRSFGIELSKNINIKTKEPVPKVTNKQSKIVTSKNFKNKNESSLKKAKIKIKRFVPEITIQETNINNDTSIKKKFFSSKDASPKEPKVEKGLVKQAVKSKSNETKRKGGKTKTTTSIFDFSASQSSPSNSDDPTKAVIQDLFKAGEISLVKYKKGSGKLKTKFKRSRKPSKKQLAIKDPIAEAPPVTIVQNMDYDEDHFDAHDDDHFDNVSVHSNNNGNTQSFSNLARHAINNNVAKSPYSSMMSNPRKIKDKKVLLALAKSFVRRSEQMNNQRRESTLQKNNTNSNNKSNLNANTQSGAATPWRVQEDLPQVFNFSRNSDNLPSFSSDVINPPSPKKNKQTPNNRSTVRNVSFSLNNSNAENMQPVFEKSKEVIETNPRKAKPHRSPLKQINIKDVINLPLLAYNSSTPYHKPAAFDPFKQSTAKANKSTNQKIIFDMSLDVAKKNDENAEVSNLFGFDQDIEQNNDEYEVNSSTNIPSSKRILHNKLKKLKRLVPEKKHRQTEKFAKPIRVSYHRTKSIFEEPVEPIQQRDIREMLSSTNKSTIQTGNNVEDKSSNSIDFTNQIVDNSKENEERNTDSLELFEDVSLSLKNNSIRTYERPKKKRTKKLRHNFVLFDESESEEETDEEPDQPKKKTKHRKNENKNVKELETFYNDFQQLCAEVENYNVVIE